MTALSEKTCIPCQGGVPMPEAEQKKYLAELDEIGPGWLIKDGHHLERTYLFPDFKSALAFTNAVGALAEEQAHHPDIHLGWGKVVIELWTHKIDGLVEADFILAAKIEKLPRPS